MKKKIVTVFLICIIIFSNSSFIVASNFTGESAIKIDEALTAVFNYLNNTEANIAESGYYEYQVPVNKSEEVTVTVEIRELPSIIPFAYNDYYFSWDTLCSYRLTINPIDGILGGSAVWELYFYTNTQPTGKMGVTYSSSQFNVIPPRTTSLDSNGSYLYSVTGSAKFDTKAYFSLKALDGYLPFTVNYYLDTEITSFGDGKVRISYNYHL